MSQLCRYRYFKIMHLWGRPLHTLHHNAGQCTTDPVKSHARHLSCLMIILYVSKAGQHYRRLVRKLCYQTKITYHRLDIIAQSRQHQHKIELYGVPVVTQTCLIPLKARAWLDLNERRKAGERVDSSDIKNARVMCFAYSKSSLQSSELICLTRYSRTCSVSLPLHQKNLTYR